jgi:hypothetical protein
VRSPDVSNSRYWTDITSITGSDAAVVDVVCNDLLLTGSAMGSSAEVALDISGIPGTSVTLKDAVGMLDGTLDIDGWNVGVDVVGLEVGMVVVGLVVGADVEGDDVTGDVVAGDVVMGDDVAGAIVTGDVVAGAVVTTSSADVAFVVSGMAGTGATLTTDVAGAVVVVVVVATGDVVTGAIVVVLSTTGGAGNATEVAGLPGSEQRTGDGCGQRQAIGQIRGTEDAPGGDGDRDALAGGSAEPLAGMMVGVTWPSARGTKAVPARKSKPTSERDLAIAQIIDQGEIEVTVETEPAEVAPGLSGQIQKENQASAT